MKNHPLTTLFSVLGLILASFVVGGCASPATAPAPAKASAPTAVPPARGTLKAAPISERFLVTLDDGRRPDVYISRGQDPVNLAKTTSWARFDLSVPVRATIAHRDGRAITVFKVLPSSAKLAAVLKGGVLEVMVDKPRQIAVVIDGAWDHPCVLFADPLNLAANLPTERANLLTFAAGVHDVGEIKLRSNMTVHLAEGAYVRGRMVGENLTNVRITGRGIFSGERDGEKTKHLVQLRNCSNVVIEGVTFINSGHYNLVLSGRNNVVRWAKIIGWRLSSDGIDVGDFGHIHDCFIKTNDDALKLYFTGMVAERCVIWQMHNGAPFQLSWNLNREVKDVVVRDIDVVRCEHFNDWDATAIFAAVHGGAGKLHHYLFENIRIENADFRLLSFQVKFNEWAKSPELGAIYRITFRNIRSEKNFKVSSRIKGNASNHGIIENIQFEKLTISGALIERAVDANFVIDEKTAWGVNFAK